MYILKSCIGSCLESFISAQIMNMGFWGTAFNLNEIAAHIFLQANIHFTPSCYASEKSYFSHAYIVLNSLCANTFFFFVVLPTNCFIDL